MVNRFCFLKILLCTTVLFFQIQTSYYLLHETFCEGICEGHLKLYNYSIKLYKLFFVKMQLPIFIFGGVGGRVRPLPHMNKLRKI